VISVMLPSRNIIDSIVVSIGNALTPGRYVRVLPKGTVHFSSTSPEGKWTSSHPQIASIH